MKLTNNKQQTTNNKAFTLIELLVVISVIGILAALLLARFGMVEKAARDTQRKSDLNQYRTALENYAAQNGGLYPTGQGVGSIRADELCTAGLTSYMSSCLRDPLDNLLDPTTRRYLYTSDSTGGLPGDPTATKYRLYIFDGLEVDDDSNWVVCWDGKVGLTPDDMSGVDAFCPIP